MRPVDVARAQALVAKMVSFNDNIRRLPGASTEARRTSLVRQMIDSFHRVEYIQRIGDRPIDPRRADPCSDLFDPLKAALIHLRAGDPDEAGWLTFLSTHFGYHVRTRWQSTRIVYGARGSLPWTWLRTSSNPDAFRSWFMENAHALTQIRFGNHRKYESIRTDARENLADVVASYVSWVGANRGHELLLRDVMESSGDNPRVAFENIYNSMTVKRFGRTGKFDYLTMMAKLGIWNIDPPHPYFGNATGPVQGASLLFTNSKIETVSRSELSAYVVELGHAISANMQVMEDSLCNWQKSPDNYIPFRG